MTHRFYKVHGDGTKKTSSGVVPRLFSTSLHASNRKSHVEVSSARPRKTIHNCGPTKGTFNLFFFYMIRVFAIVKNARSYSCRLASSSTSALALPTQEDRRGSEAKAPRFTAYCFLLWVTAAKTWPISGRVTLIVTKIKIKVNPGYKTQYLNLRMYLRTEKSYLTPHFIKYILSVVSKMGRILLKNSVVSWDTPRLHLCLRLVNNPCSVTHALLLKCNFA